MKTWKKVCALLLVLAILVAMPVQVHAQENAVPEELRQAVIQALLDREESLDIQKYDLTLEEWRAFFWQLLEEESELWYVDDNYSYSYSGTKIYSIHFRYMDTQEAEAVEAAVAAAVASCVYPGMSDVHKALALHDYLALNCQYDLTYTYYSPYDALCRGTAVCQGYSEAYKLLLNAVGIQSVVVSSPGMNHAWNLVRIDGSWYHVDVTWDDPIYDVPGRAMHDHFLLSDSGIEAQDHYGWETDIVCSGTSFDSGMFWEGVESGVVFLSAQKAVVRRDGMGTVELVSRDLQTGQETQLFYTDRSRFEYGGYQWSTTTLGLSRWDGVLYFGDLTTIYAMPETGAEPTKVCAISELGDWHYFSASHVADGKLYVTLENYEQGITQLLEVKVPGLAEHDHEWEEATCAEPKTCRICGKTEGEALGHTEVVRPAVSSTCTQTGLTKGAYCSVCGEDIMPQEVVPALGHRWDEGKMNQETGICTYTCLSCGETKAEDVNAGSDYDVSGDLDREKPTKQQIQEAWNKIGHADSEFDQMPSVTAPHATGKLSQSLLNSGRDYLNFIRYVAGLPSVQLSDSLNENAQYGAVLLAALDTLTHYPSQPADMDDSFYAKGAEATRTSNISMRYGYGSVNYLISSLSGCLADSGSNNLAAVGHRRWLLNPRLLNVGFGYAKSTSGASYVTTKVFDQSGKKVDYEFVSWPASGYVPTELFSGGDPWSITLNPSLYKKPQLSNLTVTLTRKSDGKSWTFDAGTGGPTVASEPYMTVDLNGYGISNCIIFSPGSKAIPSYTGVYTVEVTGLYTVGGEAATLRYQVEFFDLGECEHVYTTKTVEPTCDQYGYTDQVCSRCGESAGRTWLEPTGHTEETIPGKSATCQETGLTEGTRCAKCGVTLKEQESIPVTEHSWDEGKVTVEPTEEAEGTKTYTCTACGETRTETLPKLDHVHKYTDVVTAPTCEEQGYTTHTCPCGDSYVDTYVEALGHSWDDGKVTVEPTEEAEGTKTYTCTACGETKNETLPKLDHVHKYSDVITAPTCEEQGYTTHTCPCGDSYVDTYVEALGHSWDDGKVTVEPTEEAEGTKTYTCTACGETKTETLPELDHVHKYSDVITAPTCEGQGYTTHTCVCGDSYVDTYVEALGHDWDEGKVTVEPTEEAEGTKTYTCTACGETRTETLPKLNHVHKYFDVVTAPTCEAQGYTTHTCACGDSYVDTYVEALGHSYGYWLIEQEPVKGIGGMYRVCKVCGQEEHDVFEMPLTDIPNGKYYSKPVFWAYVNGITKGRTETEFKRTETCTRKQIVMFLWRAAGEPEPEKMESPFRDVGVGNSFAKAILWAVEQGITQGTGDGKQFSPDAECTRTQIVTFLYRYFGEPEVDIEDNPFTDVASGNRFASAILWAYGQDITTGTGDGTTFSPEDPCTRAQIVTFLYRALVEAEAE